MNADTPPFLSIHELEPLETGGIVARRGFTYQDHVAAAFLLDMIAEQPDQRILAAVWCEADDDITLIWQGTNEEHVEFVQVKRTQLSQLWTAAKICERNAGTGQDDVGSGDGAPMSLLEKSLAHDRCMEPCTFRLVTTWELHPDLAVLRLPLDHDHRKDGHEKIEEAVSLVAKRAERDGAFQSPKGNDVRFWVRRLVWDVRGSEQAVRDHNLDQLDHFVSVVGGYLAHDQRRELYETLLAIVKTAAEAAPLTSKAQKKLRRQDMISYVTEAIQKAQHPSLAYGGQALQRKMAGLSQSVIDTAWDLRGRYRREILAPRFLSINDRELLEAEVEAQLHALRVRLDANILQDSPEQFHSRCCDLLQSLSTQLQTLSRPPLSLLQGAMYDLTHRCLHRFTKRDLDGVFGGSTPPPAGHPSPANTLSGDPA